MQGAVGYASGQTYIGRERAAADMSNRTVPAQQRQRPLAGQVRLIAAFSTFRMGRGSSFRPQDFVL